MEAVETTANGDVAALRSLAPEVYVEVPLDGDLAPRLDAFVANGLRAKVRCGGASVPTVASLAGFVRACGERELAVQGDCRPPPRGGA